jgi:5-enolpyruvylshikimate-3-phosphate synthase
MALAAGALGARAPVTVLGAEAADITYPGFIDYLRTEYSVQ